MEITAMISDFDGPVVPISTYFLDAKQYCYRQEIYIRGKRTGDCFMRGSRQSIMDRRYRKSDAAEELTYRFFYRIADNLLSAIGKSTITFICKIKSDEEEDLGIDFFCLDGKVKWFYLRRYFARDWRASAWHLQPYVMALWARARSPERRPQHFSETFYGLQEAADRSISGRWKSDEHADPADLLLVEKIEKVFGCGKYWGRGLMYFCLNGKCYALDPETYRHRDALKKLEEAKNILGEIDRNIDLEWRYEKKSRMEHLLKRAGVDIDNNRGSWISRMGHLYSKVAKELKHDIETGKPLELARPHSARRGMTRQGTDRRGRHEHLHDIWHHG